MQKNVIENVFGTKVFNDDVMQQYLPKKTYAALRSTIENGEELVPEVANVVAHAMKEWALEIVMFVFMIITKVNWSFFR